MTFTFDFGFADGYEQIIEYGNKGAEREFAIRFRHVASETELKDLSTRRASIVDDAEKAVVLLSAERDELLVEAHHAERGDTENDVAPDAARAKSLRDKAEELKAQIARQRDEFTIDALQKLADDVVISIRLPDNDQFDYSDPDHKAAVHALPMFNACLWDAFENGYAEMRRKNLKKLRGL